MTETALGAPGAEHALPSGHVTDGRRPGPGKVVVVGQGSAGLRLALQGVRAGHLVIGVDRDVRRRGRIGAGISGLDAAVDAELAAALRVHRYVPTGDRRAAEGFDTAVIAAADGPDPAASAAAPMLAPLSTRTWSGASATRGTLSATTPGATPPFPS